MARFIQPQFFEPTQLDAITRLLDEMAISDEEGRRIFIIALEYELAEYEKERLELPAPPAGPAVAAAPENDPSLAAMADAASRLMEHLQAVPGAAADALLGRLQQQDPYQRQYDDQYLPALRLELERLLAACRESDRPTAAAAPEPTLNDADRRFILSLAEAFAECFEENPAAGQAAVLYRLLRQVIDSCGLPLQVDQTGLQELLADQVY